MLIQISEYIVILFEWGSTLFMYPTYLKVKQWNVYINYGQPLFSDMIIILSHINADSPRMGVPWILDYSPHWTYYWHVKLCSTMFTIKPG